MRAGVRAGARARRADSAVQRRGGRSAALGPAAPARLVRPLTRAATTVSAAPSRAACSATRPRSRPRSTSSPPPSCCWPRGTSTPAPPATGTAASRSRPVCSLRRTGCRWARRRSTATRASCATSSTGASPSWAGRRYLRWTGAAARSPSRSRTTSTTCSAGLAAASRPPPGVPGGRPPPATAKRARFELEGLRRAAVHHLPRGTDPYWTFPQLLAQEAALGVRSTFFVIASHGHPTDGNDPASYARRRPALLTLLRSRGAEVGVHGNERDRRDPRRAARRPRLSAVGGRRSRGRHALPLPALPLPRDAAVARRGRLPLRRQPRLRGARGLSQRLLVPVPPLRPRPRARAATGGAAAGRDGFDVCRSSTTAG